MLGTSRPWAREWTINLAIWVKKEKLKTNKVLWHWKSQHYDVHRMIAYKKCLQTYLKACLVLNNKDILWFTAYFIRHMSSTWKTCIPDASTQNIPGLGLLWDQIFFKGVYEWPTMIFNKYSIIDRRNSQNRMLAAMLAALTGSIWIGVWHIHSKGDILRIAGSTMFMISLISPFLPPLINWTVGFTLMWP